MATKKAGTEEVQLELGIPDVLPTCTKCSTQKNQGEFPRDSSKKSGYAGQCKTCRRQYREDNKAALAESRRKYRSRPENRYKTYKESAVYRGYEWLLSNTEFMVFWKQPCVYCDSEIETIGLDRIDPTLPYKAGNIESCCSSCNRMKSDLTRTEFLSHVNKIQKHSC
jgi:hypothetical protein